jgi:hypothetical protein
VVVTALRIERLKVIAADPPTGRARWTIELLADEMVRLTDHEHLADETIRRRLHEKQLKPWQHVSAGQRVPLIAANGG